MGEKKKEEVQESLIDETIDSYEQNSNKKETGDDTSKQGSAKKKSNKSTRKPKVNEVEVLRQELVEMKEKYLRLSAEFDNYRKRTLKEKMELSKTAGENILLQMLPIIDDFDRANEHVKKADSISGLKEGIELIYNKFYDFIKQQGIKEIEVTDGAFDTDLHEAVTKFPAPDDTMKGKVIDIVQKGYTLHDKVIRFAKVVVGE